MSNFPENAKLNDTGISAEDVAPKENSSIFSDPLEHRANTPVRKKKRWLSALASLLCVAILAGGTIAVIKLVPEKKDDTTDPTVEDISVINMKADDMSAVTVTNSNGSFKFYSVLEAAEDEEAEDTVVWYLDGYDKSLISTSAAASVAESASYIFASREITQKTAEECGLDSPQIKVDVESKEKGDFSILIGGKSPDNVGVYLKVSDKDAIYLADNSIVTEFEFKAIDFANTDALPGVAVTTEMGGYKNGNDELTSFDSITVTGANFPEPVVIVPNNDEQLSDYLTHLVVSPSKRIAENVDELFSLFQNGVTASGAYSFDVSAKSLAATGLDSPDFEATIKIKNYTHTFKFKLQSDGGYAAVCDGSALIKKVEGTSLPFIGYKTTDFYSSWVCLNSIVNLKGFTIKTPDAIYDFGIEVVEAEEEDDEIDTYVITHNGETIDTSEFQDFYQECVTLSCSDYTVDSLDGQAEYTFVFTFNDEIGGSSTVEFIKSSATKYQYRTDGVDMGKVNSSALKKIIKSVAELVADEA